MSLDLGELRVALQLDKDGFARGLTEAKAEMSGLSSSAQREVVNVRRTFDKGGQDAGGTLAKGINQGLIRNSPLIAAGVSGALIVGAPAALAGAGLLFGGIAAVALHNNEQVKASWSDLGADLKQGAADDAAVVVPAFTRMADGIDAEFQKLRPMLRQAFGDLAPEIDDVTGSVVAFADTAMPGAVRAVAAAQPVFSALQAVARDLGDGVTGFLDNISAHAPAAGTALSEVGRALDIVLPAVGDLLGEGAELASSVLPPVVTALGLVGDVLHVVAPVLPEVVAGFVGFKLASAAVGPLTMLAQNLAFASYNGSAFAGMAGTASTAARGLSAALPLVGIGAGLVATALPGLINLLHEGGAASNEAKTQAQSLTAALKANSGQIGENVRQMQLQKAQQDGVLDYAQKAGVSLPVVTQALTGNSSALGQVNDALQAYIDKHPGGIHDKQATGALNAKNSLNDLAAAMGLAQVGADQLSAAEQGATGSTQAVGAEAGKTASQLQGIADTSSAAQTQIGLLRTALDALTGTTVSMGDAEVAVTNATVAATTAVDGQKDAHGRLTSALTDGAGALDKHTAAGAAAWTALTQLAGADNQLISTMEQQGKTTDEVTARDAQLRDSFIQTAQKMGFSAGEAQNLANEIYGIPAQRNVQINTNAADANAAIRSVQQQIDNLHGRNVTIKILSAGSAGPAAYAVPGSGTGGYAEGGYTGGGGKYDVAGPVHRGEYVFTKDEVRAAGGPGVLYGLANALHSGGGYPTGGFVDDVRKAAGPGTLPGPWGGYGMALRSSAGVVGNGSAGGVGTTTPAATRKTEITVNTNTNDGAAIARAVSQKLRDDEFLGGIR